MQNRNYMTAYINVDLYDGNRNVRIILLINDH